MGPVVTEVYICRGRESSKVSNGQNQNIDHGGLFPEGGNEYLFSTQKPGSGCC